jgi:RNA polymerase sigma factor (sigma-70 family)
MSQTSGGGVRQHGKDSGPSDPSSEVHPELFHGLCEQARAGKNDACDQLHRLFSPVVRRTVRKWAHGTLRKLYDTDDLVQHIWLVFFLDVLPCQTFQIPRQLVRLLNRLARNEILNLYRYHVEAKKRDLSREVPLEKSLARLSDPTQALEPWQRLAVLDELEQVLSNLPVRDRAVLDALRLGDKPEEAAGRFGISTRKVWRIIERCRHRRTSLQGGSLSKTVLLHRVYRSRKPQDF